MSCVYAGGVCCTVTSAKPSGGKNHFRILHWNTGLLFFPAAWDQNMMAPGNVSGTTTRDLKSMRIRLKEKSSTRVALVEGRRESCFWRVWLGHNLSVKKQHKCMAWLYMAPLQNTSSFFQNEGLHGYSTIVFIFVGNICCNFGYGLLKNVQCQILRFFSVKNSLYV